MSESWNGLNLSSSSFFDFTETMEIIFHRQNGVVVCHIQVNNHFAVDNDGAEGEPILCMWNVVTATWVVSPIKYINAFLWITNRTNAQLLDEC